MKLGDRLHQTIRLLTSILVCFGMAVGLSLGGYTAPANASSDPEIGEIMLVAYDFCPRNWAEANGQTISINQNAALFSLLGTNYGGNGITTFNLPDLRSRIPIGYGQGRGLNRYELGQFGGQENIRLSLDSSNAKATSSADPSAVAVVNSANLQTASVSTLQPYLALRYCIALQGLYPMRPY
ncbi:MULTISPECIES: phage tail protein [Pseudanabaena]|uniref:Tail Collar domain protein n=2 Tax=Pseudanabaena TaxID=1152 RepID=L8N110_9CYAN|nr:MULTISPECIES: tail fiber protein [Pseudanabaena]ELS31943.1 Tail Collar domain protein [Pseudanabaena biceps PCC 7429]MDG3495801.1 tail fiber protein [Pseudanabaena catenata USMAC16]